MTQTTLPVDPAAAVNIWTGLAVQFGALTPMVWACTEFFAPAGVVRRRIALVCYSSLFSFIAYLIGAVKIPDLLPRFHGLLWAQMLVVLALGLGSAVLAHGAHELLPKQRKKRKP